MNNFLHYLLLPNNSCIIQKIYLYKLYKLCYDKIRCIFNLNIVYHLITNRYWLGPWVVRGIKKISMHYCCFLPLTHARNILIIRIRYFNFPADYDHFLTVIFYIFTSSHNLHKNVNIQLIQTQIIIFPFLSLIISQFALIFSYKNTIGIAGSDERKLHMLREV